MDSHKPRRGRPRKDAAPRNDAPAPITGAALELPALPDLDASGADLGTSDAAIAALEQAAAPAPDPTTPAPTAPAPTAPAPASSSSASEKVRDRSHDKPRKPIALEARELKGLQVSELRALLVTERRRNAELTTRLQAESPIAQAALDKDLQDGIAETFSLASDAAAFLLEAKEARLPAPTSERLGRVWAPIVKKYLADYSEHVPLAAAAVATITAVIDRAVAVKEAKDARRELHELTAARGSNGRFSNADAHA